MWVVGLGLRAATMASVLTAAVPAQAQPKEVVVLAAASLKNALDDASAAAAKQAGEADRVAYAASPALARQIETEARPPTCFLPPTPRGWTTPPRES